MKRDTIFYKIFQQAPERLFELIAAVVPPQQLPVPWPDPSLYQFQSIEVKETAFRIDGVFTPTTPQQPIFFAEVQMQRDNGLYERIFSEVGLFLRQNLELSRDWQVLVLYPTRTTEQTTTIVPPELFLSRRFLPIYLDELGPIAEIPLGLGLMVLTIATETAAVAGAKNLIARSRGLDSENAIIGMVAEIIVYKFNQLSREEVDAMLEIKLEETRVYQEAKAEGLTEGLAQGLTEGLAQGLTEGLAQGLTEGLAQGLTEGLAKGQKATVLTLLGQKGIELAIQDREQMDALSPDRLTDLTKSLLSFRTLEDLRQWLHSSRAQDRGNQPN
jgi:predicted transposase/invertase (TIGR01784 family)